MKLIFFQLSSPYQELTQSNYIGHDWVSGMAGPMDMREARRLESTFGGIVVQYDFDFIKNPQELIHMLNEIKSKESLNTLDKFIEVDGYREDDEIVDDFKEVFESTNERDYDTVTDKDFENALVGMGVSNSLSDIFMTEDDEVEDTPVVVKENLPSYREMMSELAQAREDGEFDYIEHAGNKKDKETIEKVYRIFLESKGE